MKGLRSIAGLAEAPALEELVLSRRVALTGADVELLASHPKLRAFEWFAEDVPDRVVQPVVARLSHLERAPILHPEEWLAEPVRVVPYDPSWPALFEREREAIEPVLGGAVTGGIHHVGSTSVPGLDAKPVIDILVGVEDLDAGLACVEALKALDYVYSRYRGDEMVWLCKPSPVRRTHHLHLVPTGSWRFRAELALRDHLRAHPETAEEYARLKHRLAREFERDRERYTEAKSGFVQGVLSRAGLARP